MKKKAFTLIELLVVITIIALLVSILMPALSKAKEQAKITLCSNNLKQQSLAVNMYANANRGSVPIYQGTGVAGQETAESWMWDMPYEVTRALNKYAGIKTNEIYCCSSNNERVYQDRRWWQFSDFGGSPDASPLLDEDKDITQLSERKRRIRVMPYIYMFDKLRANGTSKYDVIGPRLRGGRDAYWVKNLDRVKMAGEKPMIVDATIEHQNIRGQYFGLTGGGMVHLKDDSNHKSRKRGAQGIIPSGANHCYVDGHVNWIQFNEMVEQAQLGTNTPRFYWKY